jgi:hypothetical protein
MKLFTNQKLNAMVNVANTIATRTQDPHKIKEVIDYVDAMPHCQAKHYLESVIFTWVQLGKPGTAYQLCMSLSYELSQSVKLTKQDTINLVNLENAILKMKGVHHA